MKYAHILIERKDIDVYPQHAGKPLGTYIFYFFAGLWRLESGGVCVCGGASVDKKLGHLC
jgi:hypothetical protein